MFQPLHDYLLTIGIFTELKGKRVHMTLDRMAARNFFDNYEDKYKAEMREIGVNEMTLSHITEVSDRGSENFCGGSKEELLKDLEGHMDMKPYQKAYDKLDETGLLSKLKTQGALGKPRRKRRMSEHDGDWEFDRMWELKPYQNTTRKQQVLKTVRIDCNFSCSGGTASTTIRKYGALVWAIARVIEDAGIQTHIVYCERAKNVGNHTNVANRVTLKNPGEYIAPTFLAACFTANHYRRLGFALQALCVPVNDNDISCHSMGQAEPGPALEFSDGVLTIDVKANHMSYDDVEKTVLEIIGGNNG
jgi:hypothetical protein